MRAEHFHCCEHGLKHSPICYNTIIKDSDKDITKGRNKCLDKRGEFRGLC